MGIEMNRIVIAIHEHAFDRGSAIDELAADLRADPALASLEVDVLSLETKGPQNAIAETLMAWIPDVALLVTSADVIVRWAKAYVGRRESRGVWTTIFDADGNVLKRVWIKNTSHQRGDDSDGLVVVDEQPVAPNERGPLPPR